MKPAQLRGLAQSLIDDYRVSVRKVCMSIMLHKSIWYYQSVYRDDSAICMRMREFTMVGVRYGFQRIYTLLRREG
jgi:putative transposase